MQTWTIHEQLRQARVSRSESLETLGQRIGVRPSVLQSIEAGRFDELPRGIYGRAAMRAFAEALGFDGQAILRECDDRLPTVEDPIAGLARVRGLRPIGDVLSKRVTAFGLTAFVKAVSYPAHWLRSSVRSLNLTRRSGPERARPEETSAASVHAARVRQPNWRTLAAAAIDAAIVLSLLLALVGATVAFFRIPVSALGPGAAPAFAIVGMLLGITYFAVFGGIGGQTVGAKVAGLGAQSQDCSPVNLAAVATRAFRSAARDALAIEQLAAWVVCLSATNRS